MSDGTEDRVTPIYLFSDRSSLADTVAAALSDLLNCQVHPFDNPEKALSVVQGCREGPLVLVIGSDDNVTLGVIRRFAARDNRHELIAIGPADDVRGAVRAIQAGADAYFTADELTSVAERIRGNFQNARCNREASAEPCSQDPFACFVTQDPHIQSLFNIARGIAMSSVPVLISGETGVGKELFAEGIHKASGRTGKLVVENVGGLDDALFSDALFGHERGAFTGAVSRRQGLVEKARSGTLFLDEIGDASSASQLKLLRLLENKTYYQVGSDTEFRSTARIVLASNRDLLRLAKNGQFRLDLYFRLAAFHFQIPPLRSRRRDIPLLVRHFAAQAAMELRVGKADLPPAVIELLSAYDFPGNARELQSLVTCLVTNNQDDRVTEESLIDLTRSTLKRHSGPDAPVTSEVLFPDALPTVEEVTDQLVQEALRRNNGNQSAAAKLLGITPSAVNKRINRQRRR